MLNVIKLLKNPKIILLAILLVTAFLRLYRLDFPDKYVFDEVYHAFTAKEYVAGHKEAWEWWNTPPPGVAYEWTHPPLAKEIMAGSMILLRSENAWAWRLPGALLGILSVYLVYLIALKLLNSQPASLISAFVFSLDGLNFVQSRTGMNDIYYVTFLLLSLLLLLNKKYLIASLLFGLALASKWAAIYFFFLILFVLIKNKDWRKIPLFIVFPILIYLIVYIPFFTSGHNPLQFRELQMQMWWYHTHLKATHAYSSSWWSWPFNLYPVWYFVDYQKNTMANIFTSGNPVMFWLGAVALIFTLYEAIKKRVVNLMIILLGFSAFWLPWALSPRIMFLYHYSPSVPFLSLALGHQLSLMLKEDDRKRLVFLLLILIFLTFILIFPFLTGIYLPRDFIKIFFSTNFAKNPF